MFISNCIPRFIGLCIILFVVLFCNSCVKQESGCTDMVALNYNPDAIKEDGSCVYDLPIPETYFFMRQNVSSVAHKPESAFQLLVHDCYQACLNLNNSSATANDLLQYYTYTATTTTDNEPVTLAINVNVTPYTPLINDYFDWNVQVALDEVLVNTYSADTVVNMCIDSIVFRANTMPSTIGTPAIHTLANNIDAAALLHTSLLGAVLYANGHSKLDNSSNADNTTLVSGTNYTAQEQVWDESFGYFGAATDWHHYDLSTLSNETMAFSDSDNDGFIDFEREYNFSFPQMAAARDVSNLAIGEDARFVPNLSYQFLRGRTAIVNKIDTARITAKRSVLDTWEALIAATIIHHANAVLVELNEITQVNYTLNYHWTYMYGLLQALRYNPDVRLFDIEGYLSLLGAAPIYNISAANNVATLINDIQSTYDFSAAETANW